MHAVLLNRENIVECLLDGKASVDARDQLGGTALHMATALAHRKIVERLVRAGADITRVNPTIGIDALQLSLEAENLFPALAALTAVLHGNTAERSNLPGYIPTDLAIATLQWRASERGFRVACSLGHKFREAAIQSQALVLAQAARSTPSMIPELLCRGNGVLDEHVHKLLHVWL
eukprot:6875078-Prymnesium_polylepis.1